MKKIVKVVSLMLLLTGFTGNAVADERDAAPRNGAIQGRVVDNEKQLVWVDSVLNIAKEEWVIVVGHHPIYAETSKNDSERLDMQNSLDKVLRKHKQVAMYLCGHIHNFQHIRMTNNPIDYVVNSSASLSRKVKPIEGTLYCSPEAGFSVIAADQKELCLHMIDKEGKVLYTIKRRK